MARLLSLILLFALAAVPLPAAADHGADHVALTGSHSDTRFLRGEEVTVQATLGSDLYAAGERVTVADTSVGDLFVAGRRVAVRDTDADDVYAAGFDVMLAGDLEGGAFGAGAFIDLTGAVGGNALLAGGRITLGDDTDLAGDAMLAGRDLRIGGRIGGTLRAAGQRVVLRGLVEGDAVITADTVELADGAAVRGTLYHVARRLDVSPGADVGTLRPLARTVWSDTAQPREGLWRVALASGLLGAAAFVLGLGLVGFAVMAGAPGLATATTDTMQDWPWASLGIGLAVLVAPPVVAVLLMVTVIGIPLALVTLAAWFCWLAVATAMAGAWIGLMIRRKLTNALLPPGLLAGFGWLCLGLLVLMLVGLVPFAGWLVYWAAVLLALGALVMEGWSVKRREWGRV